MKKKQRTLHNKNKYLLFSAPSLLIMAVIMMVLMMVVRKIEIRNQGGKGV